MFITVLVLFFIIKMRFQKGKSISKIYITPIKKLNILFMVQVSRVNLCNCCNTDTYGQIEQLHV